MSSNKVKLLFASVAVIMITFRAESNTLVIQVLSSSVELIDFMDDAVLGTIDDDDDDFLCFNRLFGVVIVLLTCCDDRFFFLQSLSLEIIGLIIVQMSVSTG